MEDFKSSKSKKRLKFRCKVCSREVIVKSSKTKAYMRYDLLSCGHTNTTFIEKVKEADKIKLGDGKTLYPFQVEGYNFATRSGYRCLIADDPGLGKTIQALALVHHKWKELNPFLVVAKAGLCPQWQKYIVLCTGRYAPIIRRADKWIMPTGIYIVSWDSAYSMKERIVEELEIKTVIADEVQMMKNNSAKRTLGIRYICGMEIEEDE